MIAINLNELEPRTKVTLYCWSCKQKEVITVTENAIKHVNARKCLNCGGYTILPNGMIKIKKIPIKQEGN